MAAPRTRAQAALRMRQLTIDNQAREIANLKAQIAREKGKTGTYGGQEPTPDESELQKQLQEKEAEIETLKAKKDKLERDNYQLDGNNISMDNDLYKTREEARNYEKTSDIIPPTIKNQNGNTRSPNKSWTKNRVPTFDGNLDPEVSHNWLKNVETQLHLLEIPEELKVEVVTPFLEYWARKWWETVSPSLTEIEQITWQIFRREFLKQYYPTEFRLHKLSEFEGCKQTSNMTVIEYTSKFNNLGTYVPTIMSDDTLKIHRFKKGLNSRIKSALAMFKPNNFADLMGAIMSAETNIKRREEESKNKRPFISQSAQNGPKFKRPNHSNGPSKGTFNNAVSKEGNWCSIYQQNHLGECYRKTGAFFKCGKVGHQIKECPENKDKGTIPNKTNENKVNARVYAVTQDEADNTNDVVVGTFLLNEMPAYALFDCGANHSFVSRRFAKKLKLEHETLSELLRVAKTAIKTIETHKVNRNCKICISDQVFEAELTQLNMIEFDIILGMD
ncbi:uncharacterized protein LOC142505057 [Primulina tabacum]|uniref:uncharacterized protein LOC142505057 n=1 Tax=Primulina tabacum TaxID=48773 RepID=UPI003F592B3B